VRTNAEGERAREGTINSAGRERNNFEESRGARGRSMEVEEQKGKK
jgi:hypothetical protein